MNSTHSQKSASSVLFIFLCILCAKAAMCSAVANGVESHRAIEATVSRVSECTVRVDTKTDRSSGVIISPSGHILTVEHGLRRTLGRIDIVMFNGLHRSATVLKRWPDADVALLKVTDSPREKFTYLTVTKTFDAPALSGRIDVLSFGYPAREPNGLNPVVRLGRIAARDNQYLRTSCSLTAGDSGGPVTTLNGELLGIHQKIGIGRSSNRHLTLETCVQQFLMSTVFRSFHTSPSKPAVTLPVTDVSAGRVLRQITVGVSLEGHEERVTNGTLLSSSLAVTKLSELQYGVVLNVHFPDGSSTLAKLLSADPALDLALLRLNTAAPASAMNSIDSLLQKDREGYADALAIGSLVYAGNNQLPGIVSRTQRSEPSMKWKLGLQLSHNENAEIVVDGVAANSAAMDAGIQLGDAIVELEHIRLQDLDDVSNVLQDRQPGDRITFTVRRKEKTILSTGVLRHDVSEMLRRTEFLDGRSGSLSNRRSGFAHVIQHDVALTPRELGGPLLNAAGQLVGINIARRSRESVLAVPIDTVIQMVNSVSP